MKTDYLSFQTEQLDPRPRDPFMDLWISAIQVYVEDVATFVRAMSWGNGRANDGGEAYRDYKSNESAMLT